MALIFFFSCEIESEIISEEQRSRKCEEVGEGVMHYGEIIKGGSDGTTW